MFSTLLFLAWGSFLNVLAYRLIFEKSIISPKRSFCPKCKTIIAAYDNIPILSWIILKGKCRNCNKTISFLYPFVEFITAISLLSLLLKTQPNYFPAYFIFFSALIITIRTDLESMLISRAATSFLIPLGMLFSYIKIIPISLLDSIAGIILGYGFLYTLSYLFYLFTNKKGIGEGDMELLAFIGSFLGIKGCWSSLLIGSFTASIAGIIYIMLKRPLDQRIPFGPFLALGAMIYILFQEILLSILF